MRKNASLVVLLGLAVAPAAGGVRRDLGDFQIPLLQEDAAEFRKVQDPASARIETIPGSKLEVVKAASTQDAINFAVQGILGVLGGGSGNAEDDDPQADPKLPKPTTNPDPPPVADGPLPGLNELPGGVKVIETGSGYGIVGVGSASYDTRRQNPNLVLEDQRRAWMEADLKARQEIARFLNQVDVAGRQEISSNLNLVNTDSSSGANLDTTAREEYSAVVNALVTGLVTYDVADDAEKGEVRVSVVSTPKTRGEVRNCGSRAVLAGSIEQGLTEIYHQLALNVVPPVGAKMITVPSTGETVWIGFGAEVVQIADNPKVQAAIRDAALETAKLRAQTSLVALLRGQRIESKSEFASSFEEMNHQFDKIVDETGKVTIQDQEVGSSSTLSDKMQSNTTATTVNGATPAGTQLLPFEKPGSRWVYMLAVFRETVPALLKGGPPQPSTSTPPQQPAPERTTGGGGAAPPASADCPPGSVEEGVIRIRSVGTGRNKAEAIQNSLRFAVMQVNESRVNADVALKKKFADALEDVDGKLKQTLSVNTDIGENVYTVSNGLVKGFKPLYDGGIRPLVTPNSQGDQYEVELCVDIPQFDPTRPRPGQRSTIAFLGLRAGSRTFQIGSETKPERFATGQFESEVVTYLTAEKRFTVIDRAYLEQWKGELDFIKTSFEQGDMSVDEMRNVGHVLSADYVLVGTLQDIKFEQWDEYVQIRRRNEARAQLSINVQLRMIRTATGEIAFADGFSRTWSLPEISQLLGSYGNMERSLLATKEAAQALLPRILGEVAKASAEQAKIYVIKADRGGVVLANDDLSVREGDELEVYRSETIEFDGKSYESETAVARLGVTKVQGPVAHATLIQGNIEDVTVGAKCRRAQ